MYALWAVWEETIGIAVFAHGASWLGPRDRAPPKEAADATFQMRQPSGLETTIILVAYCHDGNVTTQREWERNETMVRKGPRSSFDGQSFMGCKLALTLNRVNLPRY